MRLYRHGSLLVVSALLIGACASDATTSSTTRETAPGVTVSNDRSLDVSYSAGIIELSFARLGQPFRAMYARVMRSSDGAWRYVGYLMTANANTVGTLTTEPEDQLEFLAGVNTEPAADRYVASGLSKGRYLICAALAEPGNHREVCGELSVE